MNSSPRPYLKVARLAFTQRGIRSTSSCSTLTHSTGPIPSGNSNTSGSLNGGVVNQPRPSSQITGGLRHSSIVVQMLNDGSEVIAGDDQVGAVADAELVDLAEQVVGRVAREDVRQARLDADPEEREPAGRLPRSGLRELRVTELLPGQLVRAVRVRVAQRHRHVEVVGPGGEGPSKMGMTKRGSTAFRTWVMSWARHSSATSSGLEASTRAAVNRGSSTRATTASARAAS